MPFVLLLFQEGVEENGVQILRDGGVIFFGHRHDLGDGKDPVNDIKGVKGLLGAPHAVGLLTGPLGAYLGVGIAHVGILQLLRIRSFPDILHEKAVAHRVAEKPQIDSRDSLQHIHAAAPVAQAVMRFQGDTAAVIIDPQKIAVIRLKGHGHTEIPHVLLDEGAGPVVWFQIAPEESFADGGFVGGEALQGGINGLLEDLWIYGLFQEHGQAVDGRKIPALQSRVHDSGQIQFVPDLFFCAGDAGVLFSGFKFIQSYLPSENVFHVLRVPKLCINRKA